MTINLRFLALAQPSSGGSSMCKIHQGLLFSSDWFNWKTFGGHSVSYDLTALTSHI